MQIDQQKVIEVLQVAGSIGVTVLSATAALATALYPFARPFLPAIGEALKGAIRQRIVQAGGAEAAAAFDALENAVKPGVSAAVLAFQESWSKAVRPDSDGGTAVTEKEYNDALKVGANACIAALDKQGLLEAATRACGGTEGLTKSILVLLQRDLSAKHKINRPE